MWRPKKGTEHMTTKLETPCSDRHAMILKYLLCRLDFVQVAAPWGEGYCPARSDDIHALIRAHLGELPDAEAQLPTKDKGKTKPHRARFRLGSYAPDTTGRTKWTCIDIDGPNHADGVAEPDKARAVVQQALADAGLPSFAERSQSGQGWHVWIFFREPVLASEARRLRFLIPGGIPTMSGSFADATKNRAIEVFPKHDTIRPDGFGSAVCLPFYRGESHFYRPNAAGDLEAYDPTDFETVSPEALALAIKGTPGAAPLEASGEDRPRRPEAWATWRREALSKLSLDAVYRDLLTGKTLGKGRLECKDPWSASGDRRPSANVADDVPGVERGTFYSHISGEAFSVFDFMIERGDVDTFMSACARVAALSGVPLPSHPPERPQILVDDRDLREIVADAVRAIQEGNERSRRLFRRGSELVRLASSAAGTSFEAVDLDWLYGWFSEHANWRKLTKEGMKTCWPNERVIKTVLAANFTLPKLAGVERTPFFDGDGKLVERPGYHSRSGTFLSLPKTWRMNAVTKTPSKSAVAKAITLFDEVLGDFPFVSHADRAHVLSAFITPFVRRLIDGPTPMHLFEAPSPGSGKTLLCNLVGRVVQGSPPEASVFSSSQEEQRKQITAALLRARSMVLWDNVDSDDRSGRLNSRALAMALTCDVWEDRVLRSSKTVQLPCRVLWLMTGNNPRFSMELTRRMVRCRVDPGTESLLRPRTYRHPDVAEWVSSHRAQLVHAILTLVSAWLSAGRPAGKTTLPSFESWSNVVGGVLEVAGKPGFLTNQDEFYRDADAESHEWREFVEAWWAVYGTEPVGAATLLMLAREHDLLADVFEGGSLKSQETRFGNRLQSMRGRIFEGRRIAKSVDREKPYCLSVVAPSAVGASSAPPLLPPSTSSTSSTSLAHDDWDDEADDGEPDDREAAAGEGEHGSAEPPIEFDAPPEPPMPRPLDDASDDESDDDRAFAEQLAALCSDVEEA